MKKKRQSSTLTNARPSEVIGTLAYSESAISARESRAVDPKWPGFRAGVGCTGPDKTLIANARVSESASCTSTRNTAHLWASIGYMM